MRRRASAPSRPPARRPWPRRTEPAGRAGPGRRPRSAELPRPQPVHRRRAFLRKREQEALESGQRRPLPPARLAGTPPGPDRGSESLISQGIPPVIPVSPVSAERPAPAWRPARSRCCRRWPAGRRGRSMRARACRARTALRLRLRRRARSAGRRRTGGRQTRAAVMRRRKRDRAARARRPRPLPRPP